MSSTLHERFPTSYTLETLKFCSVADRRSTLGTSRSWRSYHRCPATEPEFDELNLLVASFLLSLNKDLVRFNITFDERFTVESERYICSIVIIE